MTVAAAVAVVVIVSVAVVVVVPAYHAERCRPTPMFDTNSSVELLTPNSHPLTPAARAVLLRVYPMQ